MLFCVSTLENTRKWHGLITFCIVCFMHVHLTSSCHEQAFENDVTSIFSSLRIEKSTKLSHTCRAFVLSSLFSGTSRPQHMLTFQHSEFIYKISFFNNQTIPSGLEMPIAMGIVVFLLCLCTPVIPLIALCIDLCRTYSTDIEIAENNLQRESKYI